MEGCEADTGSSDADVDGESRADDDDDDWSWERRDATDAFGVGFARGGEEPGRFC